MSNMLLPAVGSGKPKIVRGKPWQPGEVPRGARPWVKGQSGNPAGKSALFGKMEAACREASPRSAERLIALVESEDERMAGWAADKVLERAWGKPREFDPSAEQPENAPIDPAQFSPAQRAQLRRMLELLLKAMPAEQPQNDDGTIDGTAVPVPSESK